MTVTGEDNDDDNDDNEGEQRQRRLRASAQCRVRTAAGPSGQRGRPHRLAPVRAVRSAHEPCRPTRTRARRLNHSK